VANPLEELQQLREKVGQIPAQVEQIFRRSAYLGKKSISKSERWRAYSLIQRDRERSESKSAERGKAPDLGVYGTLLNAIISPFFKKVAPEQGGGIEDMDDILGDLRPDAGPTRKRPPKAPAPAPTVFPAAPDPNDFGEGLGMPAVPPTVPLAEEPFGGETSSTAILQAILEVLREILSELQSPTGESAGLREATPFQVRDQRDVKRLPHAIPMPAGNFNRGAGR
jgi:hypothetical protein